jgi:hypothetical protein
MKALCPGGAPWRAPRGGAPGRGQSEPNRRPTVAYVGTFGVMTESHDDDRPVTASSDTPASERLPVLGDPDDDTTGDFATEHQQTSVDDDNDRETE